MHSCHGKRAGGVRSEKVVFQFPASVGGCGTRASGASGPPQSNASRSLCLLRHCRKHSGTAEGASCCGVLLAQNAEQPELERPGLVEAIPADQGAVPSAATQAASPLWGAASSSHNAVNQTSEERSAGKTARYDLWEPGTGDRPATRWYRATDIPTAILGRFIDPQAAGHRAGKKPYTGDGTRPWANQPQLGRMRISA